MKNMKAVKIKSLRNAEVVDIESPVVKDNQVLLKIAYVGFCGSDLNTYLGGNAMAKPQVIPGHEIGAKIEAVGKNVPEGLFEPGMHVTVNPYTACGKCSSCRNGRPNACRSNQTLGVQRDGAMCEYIAVPWEKVINANDLSLKECALVEPLSVGFHAVDRGEVTDTDIVMIFGCGMVGLGAVVRAVMRGATVIAVDLDTEKLALALRMGATHTINSAKESLHDKVMEFTAGNGVDVVIEAVGSPATYVAAVDEVAFTGRVVCIGYAKTEVTFQTKYFVQKELDIRGSRNAMPRDFEAVIRYMLRKECPVDELISDIVKIDDANGALAKWAVAPAKVFRIFVEF